MTIQIDGGATALLTLLTRTDPGNGSAEPYQRLRQVQSRLGDRPLLSDPDLLRTVLEWTAMADPSLFHAMFLHHCMAIGNALDQGADEADVAELASGRSIGAALMTELGYGNSSSGIRTEAVYDPATHEFVLHTPIPQAVKHPINVGAHGIARLGVVSARLLVDGVDRGTRLFLVALRDANGPRPGVVIEPRPHTALLPMDYATVAFDHVRVPYRRWLCDGASIADDGSFHDPLGEPDARSRRSVSMSRFASGAVTAGLAAAARAGVALALNHARRRPTLDRLAGTVPAIDHLEQQRLLTGATAAALAATVVARRITHRCWHIPPGGGRGHGPSSAELTEFALTKVVTDTLADSAMARCRSAVGTLGFFSENRLIGYHGFTMAFQFAGGDNRLILLNTARAMASRTGYHPPHEADAPDNWTRLFRFRERVLHSELTAGLGAEAPTFEIWNARTELAHRLAEAHTTCTTTERLHAAWHAHTLPKTHRPILADLYQLHCLEHIAPHTGWYLAHEKLTATEVLALPEQINDLCRRLIQNFEILITLLDTPDDILQNPYTRPGLLLGPQKL